MLQLFLKVWLNAWWVILYMLVWAKEFRYKCLWTPQEQSYGTGNLHTFDFIDSWNKIKYKYCVCF